MTTKPMTRGYSILGCINYIGTAYDGPTRDKMLGALPAGVRSRLDSYNKIEWYDRNEMAELMRVIAAQHPDEAAARTALVDCGQTIAKDAANTFLKLLMKVLTPTLFARKVPDIWKRDMRGGKFEADTSRVDQRVLVMHLTDVEGFDHIGPVAAGWVKFAMTSMGKRGLKQTITGWSLAAPGQRDVDMEFTWD
jgi:hypothetical protein